MQRALIEVVLLGVLGGVVGVHVLLRRLAFMTDALQHTVFPGIAIAFVAGHSLLLGALVARLAVRRAAHRWLHRRRRIDPDAALAVLIATFFSVGVVVVSRGSASRPISTRCSSAGSSTSTSARSSRPRSSPALVLAVLLLLHKELVLRAFDPNAARPRSATRVSVLDLVLNIAVTLTSWPPCAPSAPCSSSPSWSPRRRPRGS